MSIGDRLQFGVAGLATGISCGLAASIVACAIGGFMLPQLHPEFSALASVDVFVWVAFVPAGAGLVAGLAGPWMLRAFSGLAMAAPLGLMFGIFGLFTGPLIGILVRLAAVTLGLSESPDFVSPEHDILVGCEVGIVLGGLAGLRLLAWPPDWLPGGD